MQINQLPDGYRSPASLGLMASIGLGALAAASIVSVFIGIGQVVNPELAIDIADDGFESSLWLLGQGLVAILSLPVYIFTIVTFLVWLNRANKNLDFLHVENKEFSSGWAVGWWFIPFANLVKPYQVVREVWWDSDPEISDEPTFLSASLKAAPTYMGIWWALWILSNIASNITEKTYDPDVLDTVLLSGFFFITSGLLTAAAAVLAITVVRDITKRQEGRSVVVASMFAPDSPPPPPSFTQQY